MTEKRTTDRAGDLDTIRARWLYREWSLDEHGLIVTDIDDDAVLLPLVAGAPNDIRALLARLDPAHALLTDIRAWLETRPTRTPLTERLITAIVAELEG